MSDSIKNKLAELRRLKEESRALQSRILNQQANMQHQVAVQSRQRSAIDGHDVGDSYSHFLHRLHDPDLIGNLVIQDFNKLNEMAIENRLKVQRSRVLINNLMSQADIAYQDKIAGLAIDNISDRLHAESLIKQHPSNGNQCNKIKRVIVSESIEPVARRKRDTKTVSECEDSEVEPLGEDIDEDTRWHINEYINRCYELIIKVIKVYIIRASMRGFLLPNQRDIEVMKSWLEGHVLIPWSKRKSLYTGCRIYYMDIVDICPSYTGDFTVKCVEAWVIKQHKGRLLITTDKYFCKLANRLSSQGQLFCLKVINFKYPIFRKLTDKDIRDECIAKIPGPPIYPTHEESDIESDVSSEYVLSETESEQEDEYADMEYEDYKKESSDIDAGEYYYDSDSTVTEFDFSEDDNG